MFDNFWIIILFSLSLEIDWYWLKIIKRWVVCANHHALLLWKISWVSIYYAKGHQTQLQTNRVGSKFFLMPKCNSNIVITFHLLSCLGQETAKRPFSFDSSCHLPTCLPHQAETSHCPFYCWTSSKEAVNTNFYSLWFDPTAKRTRVYRFSSRRFFHSTTDRLIVE